MSEVSIRVAVVDDDAMVRAALTMMLDGIEGISVVAEVADGADVPEAVDTHSPDIVLMDLRMPQVDGITATRRLRSRPNPPDVVVLTTFDTDDDVISALQSGAAGYLLKDTPPDRLVAALRRVAEGEPILSPTITRRLMDATATTAASRRHARHALEELTDRESDVVLAVAHGRSNAEIASDLYMSVATVKAHVSSVLAKLGMTNRTQLALFVHDAGLL